MSNAQQLCLNSERVRTFVCVPRLLTVNKKISRFLLSHLMPEQRMYLNSYLTALPKRASQDINDNQLSLTSAFFGEPYSHALLQKRRAISYRHSLASIKQTDTSKHTVWLMCGD